MAGLPLTRQQELALSNHWAAKEAQRNRVQEYIRACIVYWDCAPPTRPPAGRKTMSTRWNELCVSLIKKELSQPGADLDTPLGPKPAMPKAWNGVTFATVLPRQQQVQKEEERPGLGNKAVHKNL